MIPLVSLDGRDLNHGCPKGKESGDPTVPARGIVTGRQGRRILLSLVMGGGPGSCSLAVRYPGNYESHATPRAPARQGKETGSPCWYPRDVTGRQGKRILPALVMGGGLGSCSLSASYPVGATIMVVPRDINKMLNGSGVRI